MNGRLSSHIVDALLAPEHDEFWTDQSGTLKAGTVRVFIRPIDGLYHWSVTFPTGGVADGRAFWAIFDAKADLRSFLEHQRTPVSIQRDFADQASDF